MIEKVLLLREFCSSIPSPNPNISNKVSPLIDSSSLATKR